MGRQRPAFRLCGYFCKDREMKYTFADINEILNGRGQIVSPDAEILQLLTDSRNISQGEKSLFFAIAGKHHDGNKFIMQAYQAGVKNFILEKDPGQNVPNANYLIVENSVAALQRIAAHHRKQFKFPVIGITGSNGKTIVKEWIYHLLKIKFDISRSPKSYNSQIGVPLSIWQMDERNDFAIIEAGISLPGEMEMLEKIIRPTIGIITNLGKAHAEGFENDEEKLEEKLKLFRQSEILICRKGNTLIDNAIQKNKLRSVSWSTDADTRADVLIKDIERLPDETLFTMEIDSKAIHFKIPFADEASFENAVHAILTAFIITRTLDHTNAEAVELITEQAETLPVVSMRLELKKGIHNCLLINDVYSADLNSLSIALHFLNQQSEGLKKTVILSDFDQTGEEDISLYEKVAELLIANKVEIFYGIGHIISRNKNQFEKLNAAFFESLNQFIEKYPGLNFSDQIILIKGARRFQLERISNLLALKTHGTVLKIYLHNLIHNLNTYRSLLKSGVKTMAMVKAFSYGSGQAEIARLLAHNRVDYLAVAYADEGVELRRQGIKTPIMVMNPEPETFELMFQYHLEPEIYNFRILNIFLESVQLQKILPGNDQKKNYAIHLKLDTGMHRLGFEEKNIDTLLSSLKLHPEIHVASIFSHLSSADEERHNDFTNHQIDLFQNLSWKIITELNYPVLRHILNSPGISKFPNGQFDMVRLGIGLYGVDPSEALQNKLLNVSSLQTNIAQIKEIEIGESVGYGRSFIAEKNMRIATINIGYADGFSRKMGNGVGKVFINGNYAPVVGRVCMDMTMIDISGIENVKEGDAVELFGEHISISQYAEWQQTIPYEIMTGISQRVKRVYLQE